MSEKISINGKDYAVDELSDEAKNQVINLKVADAKLSQLQQELALIQTARNAYAKALAENLPKVSQ